MGWRGRRRGVALTDAPDLGRFLAAHADVYARAVSELKQGLKTSHWMWFVFPQIAGLGHSEMARHYAIADIAEARAYLAHPVLGPRLAECARIVSAWTRQRTALQIFGDVDAVKLWSSTTLFEAAGGGDPFGSLLDAHFDGVRDPATLSLLADHPA